MTDSARHPAAPRLRRSRAAAAESPLALASYFAHAPEAPAAPAPSPASRSAAAAFLPSADPVLPLGGEEAGFTRGTVSEAVPVTHGGRTYQVRTGDTLLSIAAKHGVSAPALIELNRLRGAAALRPGQVLSLPQKAAPTRPAGHRVRKGETLNSIAWTHGIAPGQLRRANAMGESSLIVVGEVLALQGSGATSGRRRPAPPADLPALPASIAGADYPAEVLAAAALNKHLLLSRPAPSVRWAGAAVERLAGELGVSPELAFALAQQESGLNHRTVSPVNAIGIMQVTPAAGQWACALTGRRLNILDAADNIVAGLAILRRLLADAADEGAALAAYYQGAASVAAHGRAADTVRFVRAVEATADRRRRTAAERARRAAQAAPQPGAEPHSGPAAGRAAGSGPQHGGAGAW